MIRRLGFISIGCIFSVLTFAQDSTELPAKVSSNIKIAYNASILYPGVRGGIEIPLKRTAVTRVRRKKAESHRTKTQFLTGETGFYHHPTFHDNLYFLFGWQNRNQRPHGFFTEFSSQAGYSRTFLGGETYDVDEAGHVRLEKLAGYDYAVVAVGAGLGYSFDHRFSAYCRASLLTMFPSVNLIYLRPTIELGLRWHPRYFLMTTPRIVYKSPGKS